uniref:Phytase-like domain-containing protein n=1 Tax=Angiostrongylus cantonensis TaxID=6313 RepID=A0A0K0D1Q4_ANGCA
LQPARDTSPLWLIVIYFSSSQIFTLAFCLFHVDFWSDKTSHKHNIFREIFVDPATGRVYEEGDIMKRERYGFTLQLIANATDPVELFYKGGMAQTIAGEITDNGIWYVDQKDLASYETLIDEIPLLSTGLPDDLEMCGPPPPSSFVITQHIIAVMTVDLNDPQVYHRLIEAEKFAYAQRTKLGDMRFVESTRALVVPDHGTSHVTVIDREGNGVSCTSTINQIFGSMRASQTLGIIWNDEMDDFSTPGSPNAFGFAPSPSNFIAPGKRPMSSMSPMIIYNKNENSDKALGVDQSLRDAPCIRLHQVSLEVFECIYGLHNDSRWPTDVSSQCAVPILLDESGTNLPTPEGWKAWRAMGA